MPGRSASAAQPNALTDGAFSVRPQTDGEAPEAVQSEATRDSRRWHCSILRLTAFGVHRVTTAHSVAGIENLRGLAAVPPTGAWAVALPLKITGGSGSPVRAIAILPKS